ncbi:MAG: hypothetical protein JOZ75_10690 [Candidatus Dormibacteraeota bacterium]|nr:hypothetical protein [Candidatus Dormibacteraeota bacterium]
MTADAVDEFPSPADLIKAHASALGISTRTARYHVLHRDRLEAAAARPRQHAHYRKADDVDQAAILAESLVHGHCLWTGINARRGSRFSSSCVCDSA